MNKLFITIITLGLFLLTTNPVAAQIINTYTAGNFTAAVGTSAGFAPITIGYIVATVIQAALSLLALIFLILAILSGFRWMTAAGNEEQVTKAQETIKTAIIGLIIVLSAWAITWFVLTYLPFTGGGSASHLTTSG